MQFSLAQSQLVHGLTTIGRIVSSRSLLPILSGVFIAAGNEGLKLIASDNETWLEMNLPATVAAAGSLVVPARYLTDLVRRVPEPEIALNGDLAQRSLSLSWGKGNARINGYDPAEFPLTPEVEPSLQFELPRVQLRQLIRRVVFVVSSDSTRAVFTGALFTSEAGVLKMVATDGFRLAQATCPMPETGAVLQAIVPGRVLNELNTVLEQDGPPVQVLIGKSMIVFDANPVKIVSRLIEGQFPPYGQVIPTEFGTTVSMLKADFEQACQLSMVALRESGHPMQIEMDQNGLRFVARAPERGELKGEVNATVSGQDLKIAFNPRYLLEGLRAAESERVRWCLTTAAGGSCFYPEQEEEDFLYVVLPIRLE